MLYRQNRHSSHSLEQEKAMATATDTATDTVGRTAYIVGASSFSEVHPLRQVGYLLARLTPSPFSFVYLDGLL